MPLVLNSSVKLFEDDFDTATVFDSNEGVFFRVGTGGLVVLKSLSEPKSWEDIESIVFLELVLEDGESLALKEFIVRCLEIGIILEIE